jgi:hypothetical protein
MRPEATVRKEIVSNVTRRATEGRVSTATGVRKLPHLL